MKNYYEILEVSTKASSEVIEKAYKALVKKYHPDLQPENNKKDAEEKIKIINEAYSVLSNTEKKAKYDTELNKQAIYNQQYINQEQKTNNYYKNNHQEQKSNNFYQASGYVKSNYGQNINTNTYNKKQTIMQPNKTETKQNNNSDFQQQYNQAINDAYSNAYNEAYNKAYQQAYINNLKNMGYEIKYEKTLKEHLISIAAAFITIIILIVIGHILWFIPFTRNYFINLYNTNEIFKILVDIVKNVFSNLFNR